MTFRCVYISINQKKTNIELNCIYMTS